MKWIHRWPVDSLHKGPVTRKAFPFHGVNMLWCNATKRPSVYVMPWCHRKPFRITDLCEGNPPVTGGFQHKGSVTQSFNVVFKKLLNKTVEFSVISNVMTSKWRHGNDNAHLLHSSCRGKGTSTGYPVQQHNQYRREGTLPRFPSCLDLSSASSHIHRSSFSSLPPYWPAKNYSVILYAFFYVFLIVGF